MRKIAIWSLLAISTMSAAFAEGATAQSGIYVGGGAGWVSAATYGPSMEQVGATNETDVSLALQGTVGYNYAFTSNWMAGVESSYLYMGNNTYGYGSAGIAIVKNSGVQLMATGTYLASNGVNGFAKVGAVYENTAITGASAGTPFKDNSDGRSGWLPAVALGVGYMLVQNFNVALQYEHIFGDNWNVLNQPSKPTTVNMVTLGVSYTFPL